MKTITLLVGAFLAMASFALAQKTEAKLKVTDSINIRISGVPNEDVVTISGAYSVGQDGKIPIPYAGHIMARGITPSQLGKRIEVEYKKGEIFTNPTIIVTTPEKAAERAADDARRVTINGEVKAPQRAVFTEGMTLLDAIASAQGFTDWADARSVRLIRNNRTTEHDVTKISRQPELDVKLKPNDKIIVIHR